MSAGRLRSAQHVATVAAAIGLVPAELPPPGCVRSVLDIHRWCQCDWTPVFVNRKAAGWRRVRPVPWCPVRIHGTEGPR